MVEERHSVQQEGGRERSNFAAMGVGLSLDPAVGWGSVELYWVCGERYTMCSRREGEKQFFCCCHDINSRDDGAGTFAWLTELVLQLGLYVHTYTSFRAFLHQL